MWPGRSSDAVFRNWMDLEMSQYMDVGETRIFGHGWSWGRAWMQVMIAYWDLDKWGSGWRWEFTKMGVIWRQYRDLDWGERRSGWMRDVNLGDLDGVQIPPGCMWDGNLWAWVEVRRCMDGGEIIFFRSGLRWDRNMMPVRRTFWNPDGFEMVSVWSWDEIFGTCMELRYLLYGGQMRMCEPGLRWDTTWMDVRC